MTLVFCRSTKEIEDNPNQDKINDLTLKTALYTVMKILGIAYPKHWILLVVSKYLDEHLMHTDLLVLSN